VLPTSASCARGEADYAKVTMYRTFSADRIGIINGTPAFRYSFVADFVECVGLQVWFNINKFIDI
jgi:hypothetical protein